MASSSSSKLMMASDLSSRHSATSSSARSAEEVWRDIVSGDAVKDEMITLEDFLARAAEEEEEDVKVAPAAERLDLVPQAVESSLIGFGGRPKRPRPLLEPLDRAAQQRQRRMIKNRESAARSRERKQAYQVELESLAVKLEEEREMLLKEKAERTKKRLQQLIEKVIPVVEKKQRPARVIRRVRSLEW